MPADGTQFAANNPRRSHYSFEWAADQAAHPMAKAALLLEAAKVHRNNASNRIALAKSWGWPKDGHEYTLAYEALDWAAVAVNRARGYRLRASQSEAA